MVDFPNGWDTDKFIKYSESINDIIDNLVGWWDQWIFEVDADTLDFYDWLNSQFTEVFNNLDEIEDAEFHLRQFLICNTKGASDGIYEWKVPRWGGWETVFSATAHGLAAGAISNCVAGFRNNYYGSRKCNDFKKAMIIEIESESDIQDLFNGDAAQSRLTELFIRLKRLGVQVERERHIILGAIGEQVEESEFVPNQFQVSILEALDGKAMIGDDLADRVGCQRPEMFKRGLRELINRRLVKNKRGLGYYRPDSPPAGSTV